MAAAFSVQLHLKLFVLECADERDLQSLPILLFTGLEHCDQELVTTCSLDRSAYNAFIYVICRETAFEVNFIHIVSAFLLLLAGNSHFLIKYPWNLP